MAESKTELKRRWHDHEFLAKLALPQDSVPQQAHVQNVDLRGVPKLGLDGPLGWFKFHAVESRGVDLSFGDGALIANDSEISDLTCREFKFDRASSFRRSTLVRADFTKSRLRLDATDCEFTKCAFDASTFAGGLQEYGFRRCTFRECTFSGAKWQRTYLRACQFVGCDFTAMVLVASFIAGFKYESCVEFREEMFVQCEVGGVEPV